MISNIINHWYWCAHVTFGWLSWCNLWQIARGCSKNLGDVNLCNWFIVLQVVAKILQIDLCWFSLNKAYFIIYFYKIISLSLLYMILDVESNQQTFNVVCTNQDYVCSSPPYKYMITHLGVRPKKIS